MLCKDKLIYEKNVRLPQLMEKGKKKNLHGENYISQKKM